MSEPLQYRQAPHYNDFVCLSTKCEDICCSGWAISVDQKSYETYRSCSDPVLKPKFDEWVQIKPAGTSGHFATISLDESHCPFLSESLCSIQTRLGEDHLSNVCATFPRIINKVDHVIERSLDMSCPEAARLLLSDERPARFSTFTASISEPGRPARESQLNRPFSSEIREAMLSILQNRKYQIPQRLTLIGHVCGKLSELESTGNTAMVPDVLGGFSEGIDVGLYDSHLWKCSVDAALQLETLLELLIARVNLDFTPQRFRDLSKLAIDGLKMAECSTMGEIGRNYATAYDRYYAPFMANHEHIMEHYLVYYSYKMLFPFGSKGWNDCLAGLEHAPDPITAQYLLMAAFYGMTRTVMVGLAAHYRSAFSLKHAISCIQSCSKVLEHCTSYPAHLLGLLAAKGINSAVRAAILTQTPRAVLSERGVESIGADTLSETPAA